MVCDFDAELLRLPATYAAAAVAMPVKELTDLVRYDRPMMYVGSGGFSAIARLAADLHMRTTGQLAVAVNPLESVTAGVDHKTGVVLFSARGRHPDTELTITGALERRADLIVLVTSTAHNELSSALQDPRVRVISIPLPNDGFLATNGLLSLAVSLCRAYRRPLPTTLPAFAKQLIRPVRSAVVALAGPGTMAVAHDLEARLSETGMASVDRADYRSLAHGRHVGISRNIESTTIVALIDPSSNELARQTLDCLPATADRIELVSECNWPACVLDLFVQSMQLAAATARLHGFNLNNPEVQSFGKELQQLPVIGLVLPRTNEKTDAQPRG